MRSNKIQTLMKILQANMHRSKTADALIDQIATEEHIDIAMISEQYSPKNNGLWLDDSTKTASIWKLNSSTVSITQKGSTEGMVYVKTTLCTLMSCYLTPSDSMESFERKLNIIEDAARDIGGPLLIAGDFNAKALEWGESTTNSRGRKILDMAGRLGLVVANTGKATTFRRPGCQETTPDITLVSEELVSRVENWKVMEDFTGSDHQYITYEIGNRKTHNHAGSRKNLGTRKWNVSKLDTDTLIASIDRFMVDSDPRGNSLQIIGKTMQSIIRGCNASMPKSAGRGRRLAVHWWSTEIVEIRNVCLQTRRKFTRARRTGPAIEEQLQYRKAKMELKMAIERSKKKQLEELRNDVNNNPWGLGYKIVTQKLITKFRTDPMESETAERIVNALFPNHEEIREDFESTDETPPPFSEEELLQAVKSFKPNKAPGPDGIPAEVIKCIAEKRPSILLRMFNLCWANGIFPQIWKRQRLVLINKGKGDPTEPSSYRPLCMLDVTGKLFEKLIRSRLKIEVENAGDLSERQYGFRKGKSTLEAIEDVVLSVEKAQQGNNYSRKIVLLATLDVRNAFNSLQWRDIIRALKVHFSIPAYLLNVIKSYLSDRTLLYDTTRGMKTRRITSGAAQGSILGPDLWNVTYDEILRLEMPDECHLVGYADDVAAVITARDISDAKRKLNMVMSRSRAWLEQHGLSLATEKTELILLSKKHIPLKVDFDVLGTTITTNVMLKYLGIRFDSRLNFNHQIRYTAKKAEVTIGMLSRLMANVGGPTQLKRKLLMDTTNSVLLYGSEVWGKYLRAQNRRNILLAVQRTSALRVASAYRTVSQEAICIISSTVPLDLLIEERVQIWTERKHGIRVEKHFVRIETLKKLQTKWNNTVKGRWTAKLIPRIDEWFNRTQGEVNYYMTQMLSGHGYFRKYLYRMGKVEDPACLYCEDKMDDAEHKFFRCRHFESNKRKLEEEIGPIMADNIVSKMLQCKENWENIDKYVEFVLRKKKADMDNRSQRNVRGQTLDDRG